MAIDLSGIDDVRFILDHHKAVKLLRKQHAPLIIGFLWMAFKASHRHTYGSRELTTLLADYLYAANEVEELYPRPARFYLEEWTGEGFLRQFYEQQEEEATFELTPSAERALLWISELDRREFVGAESRLLQVFQMLQDLVYGSSEDKELRLTRLRRQREEIDKQIQAIEDGTLAPLDATAMRERYALIEESATKLLSDFRQIEENFRDLNARARQEQITSQAGRGEVLDEIFNAQDAILETDQGKTFHAFWAFLMDQNKQEEIDEMMHQLIEVAELSIDRQRSVVPRLKTMLVEAGDRVNRTTDRLIEQLRRFLSSRVYLENKRASEVIERIEQMALRLRDNQPKGREFTWIDGKPAVHLPMDRAPFQPSERVHILTDAPDTGDPSEVTADGLFSQHYIGRP